MHRCLSPKAPDSSELVVYFDYLHRLLWTIPALEHDISAPRQRYGTQFPFAAAALPLERSPH